MFTVDAKLLVPVEECASCGCAAQVAAGGHISIDEQSLAFQMFATR